MEKLKRPYADWVMTSDSTKHLSFKYRLALIVHATENVKEQLWGQRCK